MKKYIFRSRTRGIYLVDEFKAVQAEDIAGAEAQVDVKKYDLFVILK